MPAKPQEREYRMMSAPLVMPISAVEPDSEESRANRFDSEMYVEGYATTFDDPYVLWQDPETGWKYVEVMGRDVLEGADLSDVKLQYNHEGHVYARNKNNTLYMEANDHGLFVAADLSRTSPARDMYEEVTSGMVDRMSWAFTIAEQDVVDDAENRSTTFYVRKVKKVYDVSIVSDPADPNTEISARRAIDGVIEERKLREAQQAERVERKRKELALRSKAMKFN